MKSVVFRTTFADGSYSMRSILFVTPDVQSENTIAALRPKAS